MDLQTALVTRRSIRKYTQQPVTAEQIQAIVAKAAYAPSWKNSQTTRYIAILDPQLKDAIAQTCIPWNQKNINGAPALVIVTTVDGRSGYERDGSFTTSKGTHWQSFDAGLATEAFCLAAHDLGLGTVILGIYDQDKVASLIHLPEGQSISALIPIGVAAEAPEAPVRKTVDELLTIQ